MMRASTRVTLLCTLAGLFCVQGCQPPGTIEDNPQAEDHPQRIIVGSDDRQEVQNSRVGALGYVDGQGDVVSSCTTFAVGPSTIMTALHCLRKHETGDADAVQADLTGLMAKINDAQYAVIAQEELLVGADIAVLSVAGTLPDYFQLNESELGIGNATIISHDATDGKVYTVEDSLITTVHDLQDRRIPGLFLHRLDTRALSGSSGSPVIQGDTVVGIHLGYVSDSTFLSANSVEHTINYGVSMAGMRDAQLFSVDGVFRQEWLLPVILAAFRGVAALGSKCFAHTWCRRAVYGVGIWACTKVDKVVDWALTHALNEAAAPEDKQHATDLLKASAERVKQGDGDKPLSDTIVPRPDESQIYEYTFNQDISLGDSYYLEPKCADKIRHYDPYRSVDYEFNLARNRGMTADLEYIIKTCGNDGGLESFLESAADVYYRGSQRSGWIEGIRIDRYDQFWIDIRTGDYPGRVDGYDLDDFLIESVKVRSTVPIVVHGRGIFERELLEDELTNAQLPGFLVLAYIYPIFVEYFDAEPRSDSLISRYAWLAVTRDWDELELRTQITRDSILNHFNWVLGRAPTAEEWDEYQQQLLSGRKMSDIKDELEGKRLAPLLVPIWHLLLH